VIEPTDEMVTAYVEAWRDRLFKEPQDQDRPAVRAGLAAVLAIVERDRSVQSNPNAPRWRCNTTERCLLEDGHEGPHGFGVAAWTDGDT
jgi:hypothetical protein